jgi:hypothetical protein
MTEYHSLINEINAAFNRLNGAAEDFLLYVEKQLPEREEHWATLIFPRKETEDEAYDHLISEVMFERDKSPVEYAKQAARTADEEAAVPMGAADNLRYVENQLEEKQNLVIGRRKEYFTILAQEEKKRRSGVWSRFRKAEEVYNMLFKGGGGTPTNINGLMGEIKNFDVCSGQDLSQLAASRQDMKGQIEEEEIASKVAWETETDSDPKLLEASAWGAYLKMATASLDGYKEDGISISVEVEGKTLRCHPEVVIQN